MSYIEFKETKLGKVPCEWEIVKIDDIGSVKGGKRLPKGELLLEEETNHPYIRLVDIVDTSVDHKGLLYISEHVFEKISRYIVHQDDVCLAIVGHTIGLIFYITEKENGFNLTENAAKITDLDNSKVNPRYLFYFLISRIGQQQILANKVGSAQGKLPLKSIKDIEVALPSLKEQEKISSILGIIDKRIELNVEINNTLEEMAQAIFKRWFVDFEFPNEDGEPYKSSGGNFVESELGMIPEKWRVEELSNVAYINPREKLSKGQESIYVEMANLPCHSARVSDYVLKKYTGGTKFRNGDILFARITPCLENGKTAIVDFLEDNQVGFGSTEYIILRPSMLNSYYLYLLARDAEFRSYAIKNMNGSSGRQRVDATFIKAYKVACPPNNILQRFQYVIEPLFQQMKSNGMESKDLHKIQDALLPKLMSGEIRISDAEQEVEACLQKGN